MKFIHNKSFLVLTELMIMLTIAGSVAFAEESAISDNGSSMTNNIDSTVSANTMITQDNSSVLNNSIDTVSNTGANSASANSGGDTTIQTGSTDTTINLSNSGNVNANSSACCVNPNVDSIQTISANGADSINNINLNASAGTFVNSTNTITITNNIVGIINTGNNKADNNTNSTVTIRTGNISVNENIINSPLNINKSQTANGAYDLNTLTVNISGNGDGSKNSINSGRSNIINISSNNISNITNNSSFNLNSGVNTANGNRGGNVTIITGDISMFVDISNAVNTNDVKVPCCDKNPKDPQNPQQPATGGLIPADPLTGSSNSGSTSTGTGGSGSVLAAASTLPVTGNYSFIFLLIGNVMMFLIGVTLRLRSGRSPS
jgi:hypothetical protein